MAVDGGGWWRLVVDGGGWWWMVVVVVLLKVIVFATVVAILAVLATLVVLFLLLISLSPLHFLFLGDTRGGCPLYITVQHRMVCCRRSFGCQLPRQGQMKSTKPYSRKVLV